jgi:hypothetical protein
MEILFIGIQSEDTRALSSTEMNCLGCNDLQNFVQVERGGDDRRNAVYGSQFMHFASQLLICLLIELPVLNVDSKDTSDDLHEVNIFAGKVARVC